MLCFIVIVSCVFNQVLFMLVLIDPLLSEVSGELAEPRRHGFGWLAATLRSLIFYSLGKYSLVAET